MDLIDIIPKEWVITQEENQVELYCPILCSKMKPLSDFSEIKEKSLLINFEEKIITKISEMQCNVCKYSVDHIFRHKFTIAEGENE
jgi:hypothetical protein